MRIIVLLLRIQTNIFDPKSNAHSRMLIWCELYEQSPCSDQMDFGRPHNFIYLFIFYSKDFLPGKERKKILFFGQQQYFILLYNILNKN